MVGCNVAEENNIYPALVCDQQIHDVDSSSSKEFLDTKIIAPPISSSYNTSTLAENRMSYSTGTRCDSADTNMVDKGVLSFDKHQIELTTIESKANKPKENSNNGDNKENANNTDELEIK